MQIQNFGQFLVSLLNFQQIVEAYHDFRRRFCLSRTETHNVSTASVSWSRQLVKDQDLQTSRQSGTASRSLRTATIATSPSRSSAIPYGYRDMRRHTRSYTAEQQGKRSSPSGTTHELQVVTPGEPRRKSARLEERRRSVTSVVGDVVIESPSQGLLESDL